MNRSRLRARILVTAAWISAGLLGGCYTKPDGSPNDPDLERWYFHCKMHDKPVCKGPFRREQDATKAAYEHEFWMHMGKNVTQVDHQPCE